MRKVIVYIVVIALILGIAIPSILMFTPAEPAPAPSPDIDTLIREHSLTGSTGATESGTSSLESTATGGDLQE